MVDQEIVREVDMMKATGATRREMSYHVARRLLLDKGVRPSTQLIREYTHLGSTGDIAADLRYFWEQVAQQLKHPPLLNIRNLDPALRADVEELLSSLICSIETRFSTEKDEEISRLSRDFSERIDEMERRHKEVETSLRLKLEALEEKHATLLHDSLLSSQQLKDQLKDKEAELQRTQEEVLALRDSLSQEKANASSQKAFSDQILASSKEEAEKRIRWLEQTNEVLNGEIQFAKAQIEESRQLYKSAVKDLERNIWILKDELAAKTGIIEQLSRTEKPFKIRKRGA